MKKTALYSLIILAGTFIIYSCSSKKTITEEAPTGKSMLITASGSGFFSAPGTAVDEDGNIYVCGTFYDQVTFGDTIKKAPETHNAYLIKYDSSSKIVWVKTISGGASEEGHRFGNGLVLDKQGNIYMIGKFDKKADFGEVVLEEPGRDHLFVAKFNKDGKALWTRKAVAGSNSGANIYDLAVDNSGNLYVTGFFEKSLKLGSITLNATISYILDSPDDIFVAKYNATGDIEWAQSAGGTSDDEADAIEVDKQGNIYVAGTFSKNAKFGSFSKTGSSGSNMFLAKYNNSGQIQWVESNTGDSFTGACSMVIDDNNNIYVKGYYNNLIHFRSLELEPSLKMEGIMFSSQNFIVKYTDAGLPKWAKPIGTSSPSTGKNLKIDKDGNLYSAGQFKEEILQDEETIKSKGKMDLIIHKFDNTGKVQWVKTAAFSEFCEAKSIIIDKNKRIYVNGNYGGKGEFGENTAVSSGSTFIWRFNQ